MTLINQTTTETHPLKGKIIAIDGNAGAGKGTLSTTLARMYRLKYLDTGTLFRTVGYMVEQKGLNPEVEADAVASCDFDGYDFKHIGNNQFRVFLKDLDITKRIRTPEAGIYASKVAVFNTVRERVKEFELHYANKWKSVYGVILDGHDIGTEICPNADFKFFLEATAEARAERRIKDFEALNLDITYEEVLQQIKERDARDKGRKVAPVRPADDALVLDTTKINAEEVKEAVLSTINTKPYQQ